MPPASVTFTLSQRCCSRAAACRQADSTNAHRWLLACCFKEILDCLQDEKAIGNAQRRASSLGFLAADWAFCAAVFILSDVLYLNGMPHWIISATLAGLAAANWKLFDGTKPGERACPAESVTCMQQALLAARCLHQPETEGLRICWVVRQDL